ncbi:MAG: hypothetical protein RR767_00430 [Acinetobacter sp.]|uniref:hypothetical protein n=1 Tax=unclassified Acinetobacter TaxID=196816 RepID=UPI0022AC6726|nr:MULTISPECIES: hypothetical protein [unclassified Acinetobacter]WAU72976.1 hypothetical protein O1450_12905 [Acinetobacter sp. TR11]WAU76069.1 hypothetical protein O1449_12415 [Acinetobacter sp. TR3]
MTTLAPSDEKRVQISFRAPESRRKQIRIEAALVGLNPNEWLDRLVVRELEDLDKKKPKNQEAQ